MNNKRLRQYVGIVVAVAAYYLVHEGAHLITALLQGTFKAVHFMGVGMQIDIHRQMATDGQLFVFCIMGAVATFVASVALVLLLNKICKAKSAMLRAVMYYITIAFLFLDPLYLSVLCGFFGGGDMNGIALLVPELWARVAFGVLFVLNLWVFVKVVLPAYTESFKQQ